MTPALLAIALLLFVTLGYASLCAVSPFEACRKCNGFGFAMATDRKGKPKRGKTCRRCKGHGKRIRVGRWLYNRASHTYRLGSR
ncbi:hypothetical protein [Streptomyces flavidovirens]|uniref:hypothetical protein n=1 Tax=Streptomyces flavidovirens TaxID=67298 RepID=UPI00041AAF08|nr:hypothetical protein [Streptomyces flavidovirens]